MSEVKRTPEEQKQYEEDGARGAAASARFRRVHPAFDPSKRSNVEKMRDLVTTDGGDWTYELLEKLYAEHKAEFELRPDPDEEVAPAPVVEEKPKPEWWDAVQDKEYIEAISREDFKRWMRDPEFKKVVERVANGGSR